MRQFFTIPSFIQVLFKASVVFLHVNASPVQQSDMHALKSCFKNVV